MTEEKAYWTHEMSNLLSVSDSTLRKWCLSLEKQGYKFIKNDKGSRAFVVRDKHVLLYLKRLIQVEGRTIESASIQVFSEYGDDTRTTPVLAEEKSVRESFDQELKSINKRLEKQEEFNLKLLERIDQRDQNLMAVLREIQETRKQIAASAEKKWWHFFKK